MTTIEEQIWDYIDGNYSAIDKQTIEAKIATDANYKRIYEELTAVNQYLQKIDIDEPSMAFNRNIIELIQHEVAPVSMQTKVNQKIIYGITAVFLLLITSILIYSVSQTKFEVSSWNSDFKPIKLDWHAYLSPTLIRAFLFTDLFLAFIYLDYLLRRKKT